jgi:hypothetical protein
VAELEKSSSYKVQVAQREHLELATTVRSRLINSVTKKRDKLLREKEQLDIADSSALFLHPSQFTVNMPQSPGGNQSNRKTRHTRHRLGEAEEERLKKRKAPADDDATDSPAPSLRPLQPDTNGATSPYHDARAKTIYTQYEAPAFSIDRLFTDKELSHATVVAQLATHHFFHHSQVNNQQKAENAPSLASIDGAAHAVVAPPAITADIDDLVSNQPNASPPPPTQAPEMERVVSHHATRGATRANPLAALSEAAALTSTTNNPFVPVLIPITKTDKGAPTPPGVSAGEVDSDIALMLREDDPSTSNAEQNNDDPSNLQQIRERLLEQACQSTNGIAPFRLPILETGPAAISGGVNRMPIYGFADPDSLRFALRNGAGVGPAAVAAHAPVNIAALATAPASLINAGATMSRTTSYAGSEAGANSEMGGVGMRRVRSRFG